jgi:integrase
MDKDITMTDAGALFLARCEKKHKPATFKTFSSHIRCHIEPFMGHKPVAEISSGALRVFAEHLDGLGLAGSTVRDVLAVTKAVVESCVDHNGNYLFNVRWNAKHIDAPDVKRAEQPCATADEVSKALAKADCADRAMIALLAASGLRIGELQAVRVGPSSTSTCWRPAESIVEVRTSMFRGVEQEPKTQSACRVVEIAPEINLLLKDFVGEHTGFMFGNGSPPSESTLRYRLDKYLPAHGFHSLRRHRRTYLAEMNVPTAISKFWLGHADGDTHELYNALHRNIAIRRAEADRIGVGFQL